MIWKLKGSSRFYGALLLVVCLILIIFTLNAKAQFPIYNPFLLNPFLSQPPLPPGYQAPSIIAPTQTTAQGFSYQDYYAAYPYLQLQNSSYNSGNRTSSANSPITYVTNNTNYIPGYLPQVNTPDVYNPYQPYPPANYSSTASNTYQTVPFYPNTNNSNNTNTQTYQSNPGINNNQAYIPIPSTQTYSSPYVTAATQSAYYSPPLPQQTPNPYIPYPYTVPNAYPYPAQNAYTYTAPNFPQPNVYQQPNTYPQSQPNVYQQPNIYTQSQPNVYYPTNTYQTNQAPYSGYYVPNANYWPDTEIAEPEPPADIAGAYKGTWASETTGESGNLCAEIDQTDTQIDGSIKLKEFVIGTSGKASLTGTVNGNTVTIEINLNGPTLEFVGTVQSNGDIEGTYIVEGSSVLDEGTITLEPK